MDLGKTMGRFLRQCVSGGALEESNVAQILMDAAQCESLKRIIPEGEERKNIAANLKLQFEAGLLPVAKLGVLAACLKSQGAGVETMRGVQTASPRSSDRAVGNNTVPDFSQLPIPAKSLTVQATDDYRGDSARGQLSFLRGDRILVLKLKPGSPWAIGQRVGSDVRGLYPVEYTESIQPSPRPLITQKSIQSSPRIAPNVNPNLVSNNPRSLNSNSNVDSNPVILSPREESFPLPKFDEEIDDVNVLSGASNLAGDGRYEFEKNSKFIMEIKKKRIISKISRWMLIKSAFLGDKGLIQQCLAANVPVDYRDSLTGDTAMLVAANQGHFSLVKFLIEKCHAKGFATNNTNQSALHFAVAGKHEDMAIYLIIQGVSTLHKDASGNAPIFMAPNQKFEQAMRKAEKKSKKKLEPDGPMTRRVIAAPVRDDSTAPKVSSFQIAAKNLVRPKADSEAKESIRGVSWQSLRGTSDAVDVIFVYIAGTGSLALPVPVKRTTSADEVVSQCCQKLQLTELLRHLGLVTFSPRNESVEIPGFKPVVVVKASYPQNKFVLYPSRGAPKTVGDRLTQLAACAEQAEGEAETGV